MVALINSLVAGAGIAVFVQAMLGTERLAPVVASGVGCVVLHIATFLAYQRWRFADVDRGEPAAKGELSKGER